MVKEPAYGFAIGVSVGIGSFLLNESLFPLGSVVLLIAIYLVLHYKPRGSED